MMAASKSVVSAADHTTMTTNSVPCRIRMLPKVHRLPSHKHNRTTLWKNPKKTKTVVTTTIHAETPVKKFAPPNIQRISTPTTVASSPSASLMEKSSVSPVAVVAPTLPAVQPPKKQCAITSIPKVHKRVRAPPPVEPEILDLPLQEISFVHSEEGDDLIGDNNNIAKELMFGEDEGFEGFVHDSINREELEDGFSPDDQFLRRNLVNTSPQPNTNSSMETELRRNREKQQQQLNSSFPQGDEANDEDYISFHHHARAAGNELSFETTSSMAVGERLNLSPIRPKKEPRRQVVGEETIMDTSREVEMVRNSFFDNEEEEEETKIPIEISLVTVSTAVVDQSDFVSPMQRLRSARSLGSFQKEQSPPATTATKMEKHKQVEAMRKANLVKHLAAERKKQEAAAAAAKKKKQVEANKLSAQAKKKQQEDAKTKRTATTRTTSKARQGTLAPKKKQVVAPPKRKQAADKKKQPANKKEVNKPSRKQSQKPPIASRPSSPETTTGTSSSGSSFVPEWANKSLRKTTTTTSSVASSSEASVGSTNNKTVPAWAKKQLRKSTTTASVTSIGSGTVVSEELSSWMGKRRRASEGISSL